MIDESESLDLKFLSMMLSANLTEIISVLVGLGGIYA